MGVVADAGRKAVAVLTMRSETVANGRAPPLFAGRRGPRKCQPIGAALSDRIESVRALLALVGALLRPPAVEG